MATKLHKDEKKIKTRKLKLENGFLNQDKVKIETR